MRSRCFCYNLALGASVTHVLVWYWADLKRGEFCFHFAGCCDWRGGDTRRLIDVVVGVRSVWRFGGMRFLKNGQDNVDDLHYAVMRKVSPSLSFTMSHSDREITSTFQYNEVPQWW